MLISKLLIKLFVKLKNERLLKFLCKNKKKVAKKNSLKNKEPIKELWDSDP